MPFSIELGLFLGFFGGLIAIHQRATFAAIIRRQKTVQECINTIVYDIVNEFILAFGFTSIYTIVVRLYREIRDGPTITASWDIIALLILSLVVFSIVSLSEFTKKETVENIEENINNGWDNPLKNPFQKKLK